MTLSERLRLAELRGAGLLAAAKRYAGCLLIGDEIHDGTDGEVIAPFRHLLPALLSSRGLCLDQLRPGAWVVVQAAWLQRHPEPAFMCRECRVNWFDCGCVPGSAIILPRDERLPSWPLQVIRKGASA